MDAFRIGATAAEDDMTEAMLSSSNLGASGFADRSMSCLDGKLALGLMTADMGSPVAAVLPNPSQAGISGMLSLMGGGAPGACHFHSGINGDDNGDDDEVDEISSDDGGDFGALTDGLEDAAGYDLVRTLIAFDRQQERDIAALLAECARLEGEQDGLWRRAVVAEKTRRSSGEQQGQPATAAVPSGMFCPPQTALLEIQDTEMQPIAEPSRACRYMDPSRSHVRLHQFRYAEPDHPAEFVAVFDEGFLFRAVTAEGAWIFFNDSQKYLMNVKYRFGATSTVAAGPNARLMRLPTGEAEVEVAVAPEETQTLIVGEANGFRSLSVAAPVPEDFASAHVERLNAAIHAELLALADRSGASALRYLSAEDALRASRREGPAVPFVDPDFPPCRTSLCRRGFDGIFVRSEPWRRPGGYMSSADSEEARIFCGRVLPSDPCPGDGGDAYFCSAAALLAERPALVRALFRYPRELLLSLPEGAPAGAEELVRLAASEAAAERRAHGFRVAVLKDGWWTPTLLDDYLPASRKGPVFGRCEDDLRKLWFPLLQKAYAKTHGSYAAVQCGDVAEALQDLTGLPSSRFDGDWTAVTGDGAKAEDRAALFERLRRQWEAGYIVCLSVPDEGGDERAAAIGLVNGMSYYVRRVVEHRSFDAGATYRLVQLRCPMVRRGWKGLWSLDSGRWRGEDPELAAMCGGGDGDRTAHDGVWLDWSEEVLPIFDGGAVCHTRAGAHDYRARGEFVAGVPSVALEIEVTGDSPIEAYCMLSQEDDRGGAVDRPAPPLAPIMLCVTKPAEEEEGGGGEGASGGTQVVDCVGSADPDRPSDRLRFIVGRDIAVRYVFAPATAQEGKSGRRLYYAIPRSRGTTGHTAYTVGLVAAPPVGSSTFQVRFVQPSEHCDLFRNEYAFDASQVAQQAPCVHFQARDPAGDLCSAWGQRIEV